MLGIDTPTMIRQFAIWNQISTRVAYRVWKMLSYRAKKTAIEKYKAWEKENLEK